MMKDSNFPARSGCAQCLFHPRMLRIIEEGGVEHEQFDQSVGLLDCVIVSAAHVEQLVLELVLAAIFDVVIAENRIKVDSIGNKWGERLFEILHKVASAAIGVNVVACRDH